MHDKVTVQKAQRYCTDRWRRKYGFKHYLAPINVLADIIRWETGRPKGTAVELVVWYYEQEHQSLSEFLV